MNEDDLSLCGLAVSFKVALFAFSRDFFGLYLKGEKLVIVLYYKRKSLPPSENWKNKSNNNLLVERF